MDMYEWGRPLNQEEIKVVTEFETEMRDVVIPHVLKVMRERAEIIAKNYGRTLD